MRRLVAVLLTACALAGCGLPDSGKVDRIDPKSVPFGLLATAPPGSAPPQRGGPQTDIYFVRNQRLGIVHRRIVGANIPAEAVRLLLDGPLPIEASRGFSSDVPAQTRLISLDLSGTVATVDLSPEFGTVGGSDQVLAVAQLVYTLTASPFIDSVRFAIDGKIIDVPNGSGSLARTPRIRGDYRAVSPGGA